MAKADPELWGEYAVGALVILFRFAVRWHVVGIRNFGFEDACMLLALLSYTTITALIHLITTYGATIGQTAESVFLLPPEMVASFTIGQKLTFADWIIYLVYVWSLKAAVLALMRRLSKGLARAELAWKIVVGYTVVSFFGAFISHICVCLPVHKSWQVVPYPGDACALRNLNYYLVTYFNASTDVAIIALPMPVIFKAKIPLWRRLLLAGLLSSGIFTAIATILRAYYSLKDLTLLPVAAGWTSRETFVAAVAVSIPGIKPIFSRSNWFRSRSTTEDAYRYGSGANELRTIGGSSSQPLSFGSKGQNAWQVSKTSRKEIKGTRLSSDGSEDIILSDQPLSNIHVTTQYEVSSESTRGHSNVI